MAKEVELKLELARPDAPRLAALLGEPAATLAQHAIYFDTPGHALAAAGLSLRIRRTAGRLVQTVKADGGRAAGLFARPEWECEVADANPVIDAGSPIAALLGKQVEAIAPLFEVVVERRVWHRAEGDATIEIALDIGEVIAGERRTPLCEIEFELEHGPPAALFALARRIGEAAPLRIGVLSKSARGYRLIAAEAGAARAEPIALDPAMPSGEALQRVVAACLRQFRLNEAVLDQRRDAVALHQARVALRRLRSAFTIWKRLLGDPASERLRGELRWLAGVLGEARDLDVLIDRAGGGPLRDRLAAEREAAYAVAEGALAGGRARSLMLDLVEWSATGAWHDDPATTERGAQPVRAFAAETLDRWRRRVRRGRRALLGDDDEARHALRKDAKKLRYASEFLAGIHDGRKRTRRRRRFVAALETLQDRLGALNDLATAPLVLGRYGLADADGAGALLAACDKPALIERAGDALDDLVDAKRFWR